VFFVRDNGKGIPQEFHEDIFRIFKRLEKSQDSDDGTGAGLTFVRKIIARHNGDIWLESEVGAGTTFYFTLGKKREGQNAAA
jgi:signal transduction histidine kinase